MIYILIDTNSWMHLLESDPKSEILQLLQYWMKENAITVLIPEVIKDTEWPRIQQKHKQNVKKAHRLTVQQIKIAKSPLSGAVGHAYVAVEKKIAEVNKIIHAGTHYKYSTKVSDLVMRRSNDGLAPFHTKEKSNADGLIYFSTTEYLASKKIKEFIFISADKKGFSDPDNPDQLHPDLKVKGLAIHYFNNLHQAIHRLKTDLPKQETSLPEADIDYVTQFVIADEKKPSNILDQLHSALYQYNDQLEFIPLEILRRIYPVKTTNKKHPYTEFSVYSLGTNNSQLTDLLASIEIKPNNRFVFQNQDLLKGVTHTKKKIFEIYRKLNDNMITHIFLIGSHGKGIEIELKDNRKCSCTGCSFKRFDFFQSLSNLEDKPSEKILETMKHGHIQFHFGNFSQSLRLYYAAYKESILEEKSVRAYICFYNMKRIKHFIKGYFQNQDIDIQEIVKEIEQTSSIEEIYGYKDQSDFSQENIRWLKENQFFSEAYSDITKTVEKIRSHYHTQLNGGWSSNSNIRMLITKFVEFERYLNQNYIVFQPSEIMELFEPVMEGLFMAHAFSEKQDSRLLHFNDYLLLMMVSYARTETIYKYFNRYSLSSIKYKRGESKVWHFETITNHFFASYLSIIKTFKEKKEGEGYFFHSALQRIVLNLFTVAALTDTKRELPGQIIRSLIKITKEEKLIRKTEHEYLGSFLIRKGKYLDKHLLKELIEVAIRNEQFHDSHIFDALKRLVTKYQPSLLISDPALLEVIETNFMKKCPKCNEIHYQDCLMDIYEMVIPSFQNKIKKFLQALIVKEKNWKLYYLSSMYDIIEPVEFLDLFLPNFSSPPKKLPDSPSMFNSGELTLPELNELINLSIKFNLPIQDTLIKYKGLSSYYDWILDITNFDNKKFKPEWIMEYRTNLYLEKIFSNEKIRKIMKKHLSRTKHPKMSEYYIAFT